MYMDKGEFGKRENPIIQEKKGRDIYIVWGGKYSVKNGKKNESGISNLSSFHPLWFGILKGLCWQCHNNDLIWRWYEGIMDGILEDRSQMDFNKFKE